MKKMIFFVVMTFIIVINSSLAQTDRVLMGESFMKVLKKHGAKSVSSKIGYKDFTENAKLGDYQLKIKEGISLAMVLIRGPSQNLKKELMNAIVTDEGFILIFWSKGRWHLYFKESDEEGIPAYSGVRIFTLLKP